MLFNSYSFLLFFPIVVVIYFLVPRRKQYIWLWVASYFFYMCWDVRYILLLLFSTMVTYTSGLLITKYRETIARIIVFASVLLNLGVLFFFKYLNFAIQITNSILNKLDFSILTPEFNYLLPVGISFYIFQSLSYTIDVYRNEVTAERNFIKYALYVSFFPQLVAGPIERSKNLLRQINEEHVFNYDNMRNGLLLMLWGYFLKLMIADRAAIFVDEVFENPLQYEGVFVIIAAILFAIQIYCDFAGYSLIAKGAAEVMGFQLMNNFCAPYFAASIGEFWHRWHISLSTWLRDYLYIPLGGSRKGKIYKYRNLMLVFLASGLWHGAASTYVMWGMIHGVYQIIGDVKKSVYKNKTNILNRCFSTVITFILVDFAWIFFRAESIEIACNMICSIFKVHNLSILWDLSIYQLGLGKRDFLILFISIVILFFVDLANYNNIELRKMIVRRKLWCRWMIYYIALFSILIFGVWGGQYDLTAFIYFQF